MSRAYRDVMFSGPTAENYSYAKLLRQEISPTLQNSFSQCRKDQFNAKFGSLVVDVERRINLDNFERSHASSLSDLFHRQMRLSIGQPAAYELAGAGCC